MKSMRVERTKTGNMHTKRGIRAVAAAALATMVFAGCGMVSVNPEKDAAQVVAVIDGTEIPKGDYYEMIDTLGNSFGFTSEDLKDGDNGETMRTYVLDELINQEAAYLKAVEDGLVDTSDEHKAEVRKEIEDEMAQTKESYDSMYEDESQAQEAYDSYVESMGYDDLDAAVDEKIRTDAINDEYEKATEDVEVTDDEAREKFDEQVEEQKAAIDEDPSSFSTYQQSGSAYYNPPGSDYVKNLLIALPDDVQSEISSLRSSGDTEGADALRDEELAKIHDEAQDALDRANAGEDFDELIEELGDDPGMEAEPAKTEGYLVTENSNYVDEFEEASLALTEDGQISDLVPTDFGYHIILRVSDAEGPVDFDTVKDQIVQSETSTKKSEAYQKFLEDLKAGMEITTYPELLTVYR